MVAGGDGFGEAGGALGLQACEKHGGLDLGARNGRVEIDGCERGAVDGDRGVAFGQFDLRAHLGQGFADAFHGAWGEGFVTDEGEGVGMRGDEAGEHPHGGTGVSAVERGAWLLELAGGADDFDVAVALVYLSSE